MALTFSLIDTWDDGKRVHVSGTIAASGNYTTGGDTLDLSQSPLVASAQPPINGTAWMDGLAGYDYVFLPGAAMNSNKVKIFQQGAAAGAFPERKTRKPKNAVFDLACLARTAPRSYAGTGRIACATQTSSHPHHVHRNLFASASHHLRHLAHAA